ncbi:two-component sensor histidine kinase [Pseudomonas sp. HMWF032]|uniref:ATP-binding protein n=1 Tax=unclassified Pseudomonas TaxID=196821 RepID=UPI000D3D2E01|nr:MULTISPECIES: ATP-binding protein [unclassified Pseudomonas]PTS83127.1 two-component sensor histidine kinase [Pseudomonas sp. HMWF032]PTT81518.1 two-component sensor histidine kinase [Pseudomonas sp. HMWF010]WAC45180.1 ATP-binding protein [Pseudomonas sp. SL4(2022)]
MTSIRARTLLLVLGLLSLSMTLISYKSYRDAQHEIEELFDAQLAQTARVLAGLVGRGMLQSERDNLQRTLNQALQNHQVNDNTTTQAGHAYEGKLAFQVLDEQGELLLQSASAPTGVLAQMVAEFHRFDNDAHQHADGETLSSLSAHLIGYHTVPLNGHHWRLFMLNDATDQHMILVAEREDVRGELVKKIALRSLLPDLIGLPLLALLVWLAIGWGLRPLQRMAELIKARAPDNLAPLILEPLPAELEPMGASLNRLLMQVNLLLDQEKRFIADAAHELRTPLAVLRIHAQNALEAPDPQDRNEALRLLGTGVERATRVVAQLLTLARLDPTVVQLAMGELDLLGYVRNELAELIPLALARQQELNLDAPEPADYQLLADGPSLGTLLQNLISNAVQYTPDGGRIQVQLDAQADAIVLRVQDSGPGVDEAQREKLFERFYRLGTGQGAGLGLSIVLRVVELHRGSISLGDSPLGGLEVAVRLPRR